MKHDEKQPKPYTKPEITKVKLEDRRVVAMAIRKDSLDKRPARKAI